MSWWTDPENVKHQWEFLAATGGALAGTVAGAWVALSGDRRRRAKELEDRRVEAANLAIFSLSEIANHIWDYSRNIIEPRVPRPDAWYTIAGCRMPGPTVASFEATGLAFLWEGEHRNLPNRIAIDFVRYEGFLEFVRLANNTNLEVQKLAASQVRVPDSFEAIEALMGPVTKSILQSYVGGIVEHVGKLGPSVAEAALALRAAMLSMYPKRMIIRFVLEEGQPADVELKPRNWRRRRLQLPWPSA